MGGRVNFFLEEEAARDEEGSRNKKKRWKSGSWKRKRMNSKDYFLK